jgi:hypothetical protein
MNPILKSTGRYAGFGILVMVSTAMAVHQMLPHTHTPKPAPADFGFGPRASAQGTYSARIEPQEKLKTGKMQNMIVTITDKAGKPVSGAKITVDGGMPQHGHGLPTQPKVTRELGNGAYQVEGVKFNMGGWWVFTFHVDAEAGCDSVTFNLGL